MTPLVKPPWDYITAGPWMVTFEWQNGKMESSHFADLPHAIFNLLDARYPIVHRKSPHRRVLVDARGICILGVIERVPADPPCVATEEVIEVCESIGMDPQALMFLRLEIMWDNETS